MRHPALTGSATLAGIRLAAHVGPAATWLPALRPAWLAGRGRPGHVALTFDDGPSAEHTPRVLEVLRRFDVRATFFLIAEQLRERANADVGRAIVAQGHEVAVHGWRHHYLLGTSYRRTLAELSRAREAIGELAGAPPRWFRPPYGVLTGEAALAARRLGLRPVLWTVWARDWTPSASPERILALLRPGLVDGATVLLHDVTPSGATAAALPRIIGEIRARGLCPGPLRAHGLPGR